MELVLPAMPCIDVIVSGAVVATAAAAAAAESAVQSHSRRARGRTKSDCLTAATGAAAAQHSASHPRLRRELPSTNLASSTGPASHCGSASLLPSALLCSAHCRLSLSVVSPQLALPLTERSRANGDGHVTRRPRALLVAFLLRRGCEEPLSAASHHPGRQLSLLRVLPILPVHIDCTPLHLLSTSIFPARQSSLCSSLPLSSIPPSPSLLPPSSLSSPVLPPFPPTHPPRPPRVPSPARSSWWPSSKRS